MLLRYAARRARRLAEALLLAAVPEGGQRTARRNAWAGMVRDASLAQARREAAASMEEVARRRPVAAVAAH